MNKEFIKELKRVLEDNKEKIKIIEEKKTDISKKYNNEELFLLWAYYMEKIDVSPYLSCFDLIRKEYGYIVYKIYGKESCKFFMKDTNNTKDKEVWNKKSSRRDASDIVMIYRRRGQNFLRDSLKPKKETELQKKYLMPECNGFLNELGIGRVKGLINKQTEDQFDISLRNILSYINDNFKSEKKYIYDSVFKPLGEFSIRNHGKLKENKEEFINTWNQVLKFIWNESNNLTNNKYAHFYLLVGTHLINDYGYFNKIDTNKLFRVKND